MAPKQNYKYTLYHMTVRIHFEYDDLLTSGVDTKGTPGGAGRATVTLLKEALKRWLFSYHAEKSHCTWRGHKFGAVCGFFGIFLCGFAVFTPPPPTPQCPPLLVD